MKKRSRKIIRKVASQQERILGRVNQSQRTLTKKMARILQKMKIRMTRKKRRKVPSTT